MTNSNKQKKKDRIAENISTLTSKFSNYLEQRDTAKPTPPLKHFSMWANFDSLASKLNDDEIEDLNIDITNLIGTALKKSRERRTQ